MRSMLVHSAKCLALIIGVLGAVVIALLTGFLSVPEMAGAVIFGVIDAIGMFFIELSSGMPLESPYRKRTAASGRLGQEAFIRWIWLLGGRTSGSRVEIDTSQCKPHLPQEPVKVIGPHPTMEAATAQSLGLMSHFYGPIRWVIKWELMVFFAPVILPFLVAGAGYPLVRESKWLSRWVLRWFGAIHSGVAAIFPDGTRPAEKKGRAAQRWLQNNGCSQQAAQWIYPVALPRPGGIMTLLAANPTARVVLAVTSGGVPGQSVPADFWRLVFGPPTVYRVTLIDLNRKALDAAAAQGDRELGQLLVQLWIEKVFPLLKAGGMQPMETEE